MYYSVLKFTKENIFMKRCFTNMIMILDPPIYSEHLVFVQINREYQGRLLRYKMNKLCHFGFSFTLFKKLSKNVTGIFNSIVILLNLT